MKAKKSYAHKFMAQPFGWRVYFCVSKEGWAKCSHRKFGGGVKKHLALVSGAGDAGHSAFDPERMTAVIGVFNAGHGILAHEATHIANAILALAQVEPSFSNDETQAYLVQHIVEECTPDLLRSK